MSRPEIPETDLHFASKLDDLVDSVDKIQANDDIEFAKRTADLTHRAIKYTSITQFNDPITPENLDRTRHSNCYGSSLVVSELLSRHSIDNMIIAVSQHVAVLALAENRKRAFVADAAVPMVSMEVDSNMFHAVDKMGDELSYNGIENRSAAVWDLQESLSRMSHDQREKQQYWMSFRRNSYIDPRSVVETKESKRWMLRASLTESGIGRKMLDNLANYQFSMVKDSADAEQFLRPLSEVWPLVDRRSIGQHGWLFDDLRISLSAMAHRKDERVLDIIDNVSDSMTTVSNDLSIKLWRADMLRRLARDSANKIDPKELLDTAIADIKVQSELIAKSSNSAGQRELVRGKLNKAKRERARF